MSTVASLHEIPSSSLLIPDLTSLPFAKSSDEALANSLMQLGSFFKDPYINKFYAQPVAEFLDMNLAELQKFSMNFMDNSAALTKASEKFKSIEGELNSAHRQIESLILPTLAPPSEDLSSKRLEIETQTQLIDRLTRQIDALNNRKKKGVKGLNPEIERLKRKRAPMTATLDRMKKELEHSEAMMQKEKAPLNEYMCRKSFLEKEIPVLEEKMDAATAHYLKYSVLSIEAIRVLESKISSKEDIQAYLRLVKALYPS